MKKKNISDKILRSYYGANINKLQNQNINEGIVQRNFSYYNRGKQNFVLHLQKKSNFNTLRRK